MLHIVAYTGAMAAIAPAALELIGQGGGAACLDGSAPGYWVQPGAADRFYVHMEGGSWCTSADDCARRSVGPMGSSRGLPATVDLGALATPFGGWYFSDSPDVNPSMASWTKVLVQACDGTSWSGSNETTTRAGSVDLHFRGAQNLAGLIEALQAGHALNAAREVVVGGGAGGGLAMERHVERIRAALARSGCAASVRALSGGAAAAEEDAQRATGAEWLFTQSNASASLAHECLDAHSAPTKWKCLLSMYDSPLACAAGSFRNGTACAPCPPGHFCPAHTLERTTGRWVATTAPHACPAGTHRAADGAAGAADCVPCSAGEGFFCAAGAATPAACPPGSFCPSAASAPRACPAGAFCPAGARDPVPCPAGRLCVAGVAVPALCPLGSFCPPGSAVAVQCPLGTRGVAGVVGSGRTDAASACAPCPAGTSAGDDAAARACPLCPAGSHCAGGSASAALCPPGHFCPPGAVAPSACPPGTRGARAGATSAAGCEPCPVGAFQDAAGQAACR